VRAAAVSRAWREATLLPDLWRSVELLLDEEQLQPGVDAAESFAHWLMPRSGAVRSLSMDLQSSSNTHVLFALTSLAPAAAGLSGLTSLHIETPAALTVGQWVAALPELRSACFLGGTLSLRPGLDQLRRLRELELGSCNEAAVVWALPRSITKLSLENCELSALPEDVMRLTQLRSLDLCNNEGIDTALLARLTKLECLKLANCGLAAAPRELSALGRLRILHLGGNLQPAEPAVAEHAEQALRSLRPLRSLRCLEVLVLSQCGVPLQDFVCELEHLKFLSVSNTSTTALRPGAYCRSLRHLLVDWDVAFQSTEMLASCSGLQQLSLARPRSTEPDPQSAGAARELAQVLLRHPTLRRVNVVAAHEALNLSRATLEFMLALQPKLAVLDDWGAPELRVPNLEDIIETDLCGC
jgi:hypothetical protein